MVWHEHENASADEEVVLFSISDAPIFEALSLHREEPYGERGGHQEVKSSA